MATVPDPPTSVAGVRRSVQFVLDADAALQDLCHSARTGNLGNIATLCLTSDVLMPSPMVAEVEVGIAKVARDDGEAERMRSLWSLSYLRWIKVLDEEGPSDGEAWTRLSVRDPKDLPVLGAAMGRSLAVILTNDTDLIDEGFAPASWLATTRVAEPVALADATLVGAATSLRFAGAVTSEVVAAARRGSLAAQLTLLGSVVLLIYVASEPARRRQAASIGSGFARYLGNVAMQKEVGLQQLRPWMGAAHASGASVSPEANSLQRTP